MKRFASDKRTLGLAACLIITSILGAGLALAADEIHWTITGPTSVTFDWRGAETTIRYGTTDAYGQIAAAQAPSPPPFSSAGPFREARIAGLLENTLYHYSIGTGPDHTFRTPPPPGAGFTVYVEGDIGSSGSYRNMPLVQGLIAAGTPAFVLMVGDLTYGHVNGQAQVDQHYNDVMVWSQDAAYMPVWGNAEWDRATDDLRNYKGRFELPNPQTSPGSPAVSCCGEDWSWFDYGNVRFIAYPEPWGSGVATADWSAKAKILMDEAQADPRITFIVTFGHRPAYSSGHHPGSPSLQRYMGILGAGHSKYVLNLNGHSHNYERTNPINGVVHITVAGGGANLEQDGVCLYLTCLQPSWSAFRAMRLGPVKLTFGARSITGSSICGPPGGGLNDVTCTPGSAVDVFTLNAPADTVPPTVALTAPAADAVLTGAVAVTAAAADNVGVAGVQFTLDGVNLGAEVSAAPYTRTWDTSAAVPGAHTLGAVARDAAANTAASSAVAVTVADQQPPAVAISAPAAGALLGGAVEVTATASDNVGVAGVQFTLDGASLGPEDTVAPYAATWDTSAAAPGPHTLGAVARDAAGNTAAAVAVGATAADQQAPTVGLTAPGAGAALTDVVVVTAAASDNVGVAGVQFKLDGVNLGAEDTAAPYSVSWAAGAAAPGPHTLGAVARDAAGNAAAAASVAVTTSAASNPDTVPPVIALTAPAAGATLTGAVAVRAAASDNVGVAGVQFKLDGVNFGPEDTVAPYSKSWSTAAATAGVHTLGAVARDAAGNTAPAAAVVVTVADQRAPTVSLSAPLSGATLTGAVAVTAAASDNVGVAGVQFTLDGANLGAEDTAAPYAITWDTSAAAAGAHTLGAVARDAAGNTAASTAVAVTIASMPDTVPPAVALAAPVAGATLRGAVVLTATAADNVGVVGVQFTLDGANLGAEDTTAPYAITWDTSTAAAGVHTLGAVARDAAGNTAPAAAVVVTAADQQAPAVGLTAPAAGATLTGSVVVTATAADNVSVAGVQFTLDGANLGAEDTAAPYAITWDTTSTAAGVHTLGAVARDAAGNTTPAAAVVVTAADQQAPAVGLTAPVAGATLRGSVAVTATAADNVGVAGVQFTLDGVNLGPEDTAAPYAITWDTSTAAAGVHTLGAVARDAAGNTAPAAAVVVTAADQQAPAVGLTAPAAGATLTGSVVVTATAADNVSVAGVQFKLDGANLGAEDTTAPYAVTWNSASAAAGAHTLAAVARDTAGNTTPAAAVPVTVADQRAPTVGLTTPAAGALVTGTISVTAAAADNVGVAGVQFKLDGVNLGVEDTTAPYSVAWNSASAAAGAHTLGAVARDAAGNTATAAALGVTSSDQRAPSVGLTAPLAGALVTGTISVTAAATDNVGVAGVQFKLDGANLGAEDTTPPYAVTWNTASATPGAHTLGAVARDAAGNTGASAAVVVTAADQQTPSVAITAPLEGSIVTGTISVTAAATDNVGVAGVQFLLDGVNLAVEDTTAPYTISWNTLTTTRGLHTLTAAARDAAGNVTISAPVAITRSNSGGG